MCMNIHFNPSVTQCSAQSIVMVVDAIWLVELLALNKKTAEFSTVLHNHDLVI